MAAFQSLPSNKIENLSCCTSGSSITSARKGVGGGGRTLQNAEWSPETNYRAILAPQWLIYRKKTT